MSVKRLEAQQKRREERIVEEKRKAVERVRRETEVLRLVAQGLANKQIARALGITERTVKAHLGRVFREIGVLDRTSAALWARDNLPGA